MSSADAPAPRKFRFAAGGEGNAEEGGARRFIKLAQKAEELGYDSFMIPDHLGNQVGPIAALGALAVATDKIRIGTTYKEVLELSVAINNHVGRTADQLLAEQCALATSPEAVRQ